MRPRLLPFALALPLALLGCGSDDEPGALPELTATPTATAEATASAEPAEATPTSPGDFVRFVYQQLEEAYASADSDIVQPLLSDDCVNCQRVIAAIDQLTEDGNRVTGYQVTVVDTVAPQVSPEETTATVTAFLDFTDYVEVDGAGNEVAREPGGEQVVQELTLRRTSDGWTVTALETQ